MLFQIQLSTFTQNHLHPVYKRAKISHRKTNAPLQRRRRLQTAVVAVASKGFSRRRNSSLRPHSQSCGEKLRTIWLKSTELHWLICIQQENSPAGFVTRSALATTAATTAAVVVSRVQHQLLEAAFHVEVIHLKLLHEAFTL